MREKGNYACKELFVLNHTNIFSKENKHYANDILLDIYAEPLFSPELWQTKEIKMWNMTLALKGIFVEQTQKE